MCSGVLLRSSAIAEGEGLEFQVEPVGALYCFGRVGGLSLLFIERNFEKRVLLTPKWRFKIKIPYGF